MSLLKSRFIEMFKNSETLRLDQIAEVTMGQSPDSSSYNSVGKGIPFYQGKTEFTDKYIGQPSTWCTSPTRIAKENDILMSVRAPVGNVNIATEECCIGRGLSSIRPQNGFNSEFIFEALEQKKEELENKATGSTFKAINKDIVLSIQIPNTSISIQKEYSNFVKQIDKSKFLLQQILEKFELLKKSRFIEMFGDVINNKKTWPTKRWSDVLNIVNGKNQKKVECENGIYPICGSGGKIGKTNEYLTKENSVIIGRKGNINNPILMKTKFWNVDTAFGLEPNNKEINVEYLYKFCELFDFQRLNKTVTIPSLTKSDLLKIEIPVPPMKLQEEYRNFLAQVDKSKLIIQKALEDLVGKV